jgi:hypothetical protein
MGSTCSLHHRSRRLHHRAGALAAVLVSACAASVASADATPGPTPTGPDASARIFRGMRTKVIIEVAERDINAYLREHPEDFAIPGDFGAPRVAFVTGQIEVSARTKVLFVSTRVSVEMTPRVVGGRLHLEVRRVRASGIPLPTFLQHGVAGTIEGVINKTLDGNGLRLLAVAAMPGLVRLTAQAEPDPAHTPGPALAPKAP